VATREHQIENDHVKGFRARLLQPRLAIEGQGHGNAVLLEVLGRELRQSFVVLDQKHEGIVRHRNLLPGSVARGNLGPKRSTQMDTRLGPSQRSAQRRPRLQMETRRRCLGHRATRGSRRLVTLWAAGPSPPWIGYGFGREAYRCALRKRWIPALDPAGNAI